MHIAQRHTETDTPDARRDGNARARAHAAPVPVPVPVPVVTVVGGVRSGRGVGPLRSGAGGVRDGACPKE